MMVLKEKHTRLAVIISVLAHLLLLLIFVLIKVSLPIDIPEFIEISFVSGRNQLVATSIGKQAMQSQRPELIQEEQNEASEVVTLPERKMPEEEEPQLRVAAQKKQIPSEEVQTLSDLKTTDNKKEFNEKLLSQPSREEKKFALPGASISPDEKILPTTATATESSGQTPYQIEGPAARRIVTSRVIPEYPDNLQKQAIIKITFTVLPNGQVGEMIPIIKSDALLEKITIDALRQWRFNPLPINVPQSPERGIITFRYLLK